MYPEDPSGICRLHYREYCPDCHVEKPVETIESLKKQLYIEQNQHKDTENELQEAKDTIEGYKIEASETGTYVTVESYDTLKKQLGEAREEIDRLQLTKAGDKHNPNYINVESLYPPNVEIDD